MGQGRKETDRKLLELEKKIRKEYDQAQKEIQKKLDEHFEKFKIKDITKRRQLNDGIITTEEYKQWKIGQMATGDRWRDMRDTIANDLMNTEKIAKSTAEGYMPEVYCINMNYATYEVESALKIDTSFTLYNHQAVERIVRDNPMLLPPPGKTMQKKLLQGKAKKWKEGMIQSVTTQSILQGESVPHMADRISRDLCVKDRKAAIRYARTAVTGAENAGKLDGYKRAQSLGIKMKRMWVAVLDSRTRDAHRELDGQVRDLDEPFENSLGEIMYPGDPSAAPANFWNCRCGTVSQIEGFENDVSDLSWRNTDKMEEESYDEWKAAHGKSQDILNPDKVAAIMKARYIKDYKK